MQHFSTFFSLRGFVLKDVKIYSSEGSTLTKIPHSQTLRIILSSSIFSQSLLITNETEALFTKMYEKYKILWNLTIFRIKGISTSVFLKLTKKAGDGRILFYQFLKPVVHLCLCSLVSLPIFLSFHFLFYFKTLRRYNSLAFRVPWVENSFST